MFGINNPIPPAIRDSDKEGLFWRSMAKKRRRLIPYYKDGTNTAHGFLTVFQDICRLSDSVKACVKWTRQYAFGGKIGTVDIIERPTPGVEEESEILSPTERQPFLDWLKEVGIRPTQFAKHTCKLFLHDVESGNSYLRIRITRVDDVIRVSFKPIPPREIAYIEDKETGIRRLVVAKKWEYHSGKFTGEEYPVSEMGEDWVWDDLEGGMSQTILHVKNDVDDSDWYGRPDLLPVLMWMGSEHKTGEHNFKVNSTSTVATKIISVKKEYEEEEEVLCSNCEKEDCANSGKQQGSFQKKAHTLRKLTTNEGDIGEVKGLALLEYEEEAPKDITLDISRNPAWMKESLSTSSRKIHSIMRVPVELTGAMQGKSGLGGQQIMNLFIMTDGSMVTPLRGEWANYWSEAIGQIAEKLGREDMVKYGIRFPDRIEKVIEALRLTLKKDNHANANGNN